MNLSKAHPDTLLLQRVRILVQGAVQGVGFRPFVYRLATELGLAGSVRNSNDGVTIEVEGHKVMIETFVDRLQREAPALARISKVECLCLKPEHEERFEIVESANDGPKSAAILPDVATCPECLSEINDPNNRRYLYPFTNCTNCGPRFSIIESLPYDRPNTSMKRFSMCPRCLEEYHDPNSRRFHAQPNACPDCGPHLELWEASGGVLSSHGKALTQAAEAIRAGLIVALKGVGGFQLLADARNAKAIQTLRARKQREEKPFAVMFPNLESVEACCEVSELERKLLLSPEAPIVLLDRAAPVGNLCYEDVVDAVAPGNPRLGVMLPHSPLHHLLMQQLEFPVVATSGNLSDEPICIDQHEALRRLKGIADLFLVHDRPIIRHMDDSIVQVLLGRQMILRRARGYAPLPIQIAETPAPILAVGAHLKNTVAIACRANVFISQHIGNLETAEALSAFREATTDLPKLYGTSPGAIACDLHPDYFSTDFARAAQIPLVQVQHHYAHILSCMAENELQPRVLGVAWDGTGLGPDGTIWGGEFLLVTDDTFERLAHLRQFRLAGGDAAIKEPRRSALGVLHEICSSDVFENGLEFSTNELVLIRRMLEKPLNAPFTSSAGRLFDTVAALLGLRSKTTFEGQAAMELEFAIQQPVTEAYSFNVQGAAPLIVDWEPAITAILNDIKRGEAIGVVAAKFHNGLVQSIVEVVTRIGEPKVVLTGGCFQNKYLLEQTVRHLQANGVQVYWHHKVPPNDGGIALGQIMAAMRTSRTTSPHSSDVQITTGTGFSAEIQSLATSATADS